MSTTDLRRRLARLERTTAQACADQQPGIWIVTESDDDQARQIRELTAAGAYHPGRILVAWRIVDPSRPEGQTYEHH